MFSSWPALVFKRGRGEAEPPPPAAAQLARLLPAPGEAGTTTAPARPWQDPGPCPRPPHASPIVAGPTIDLGAEEPLTLL